MAAKKKFIEYHQDMSLEDYKKFIEQEVGFGLKHPGMYKHWPKPRTIQYLHDLFLRVNERANKRRKMKSDLIDEIVSVIPMDSDDKWVIYRMDDKALGGYQTVEFSMGGFYGPKKSLCYSHGYRRSDDGRKENLKFLTAPEKAFEYGDKFREVEILADNRSLLYAVMGRLDKYVKFRLKEMGIEEGYNLPPSITIDICGYKYVGSVERGSTYPRIEFDYFNPNPDIIPII